MQTHPVIERYLDSFAAAFDAFEVSDRDEIVQEIRNHIAEARASGTPLAAVLETLGPTEALARAYAIELSLNPKEIARSETRPGLLAAIRATSARPLGAVARAPRAVATKKCGAAPSGALLNSPPMGTPFS